MDKLQLDKWVNSVHESNQINGFYFSEQNVRICSTAAVDGHFRFGILDANRAPVRGEQVRALQRDHRGAGALCVPELSKGHGSLCLLGAGRLGFGRRRGRRVHAGSAVVRAAVAHWSRRVHSQATEPRQAGGLGTVAHEGRNFGGLHTGIGKLVVCSFMAGRQGRAETGGQVDAPSVISGGK